MEFEKLKGIIASLLLIDPDEITEETRFVGDLGMDSLDVYQMICEIEDAFDIQIGEGAVENAVTVGAAAAYIKTRA